nr:DNA methyltransferase [Campylobacter sp. LR264d]
MFEELDIFLKENLINQNKFNEINEKLKNGEYFLQPYNDNVNLICKHNTENTSLMYSIISGIWNSDGTTELGNIMGNENIFNNPKPIELIKYLLKSPQSQIISQWREYSIESSTDSSGDIILDFFAGSGTTAHALM